MITKGLRYMVLNNSLYLFSACCMLYGCYLMFGNRPAQGSILPDLALLGTMKVYELLVTLFACLVLRRVRVEADGGIHAERNRDVGHVQSVSDARELVGRRGGHAAMIA